MQLQLDAETLYAELVHGVRGLIRPGAASETSLVGIWSGGAWLAERLHRDLALAGSPGVITSTLHRDDFASRGLASQIRWACVAMCGSAKGIPTRPGPGT